MEFLIQHFRVVMLFLIVQNILPNPKNISNQRGHVYTFSEKFAGISLTVKCDDCI